MDQEGRSSSTALYVLNNPWSIQSMEKHTTYCAMMRLGMPVPDTWMVPPKAVRAARPTSRSRSSATRKLFDLGEVGRQVGYPLFMKPYDGGGWVGRQRRSTTRSSSARAYDESGKYVHAPAEGGRAATTCSCAASASGRRPGSSATTRRRRSTSATRSTTDFVDARGRSADLSDMTLTINSFFGWDFNSCEALRQDGVWHPIDFANAVPRLAR